MMLINNLFKVPQSTPGFGVYLFGEDHITTGEGLAQTPYQRPQTIAVQKKVKMSQQIAQAVLFSDNVSYANTTHGFFCECDDLDGTNSSKRYPVLLDPTTKKIFHSDCDEFQRNKRTICSHVVVAVMGYCILEGVGNIKGHPFWSNAAQERDAILNQNQRSLEFEELCDEVFETLRHDLSNPDPATKPPVGVSQWTGEDYPTLTPRFLDDKTPNVFGRGGMFTLRRRLVMPTAATGPIGTTQQTTAQATSAPAGGGFMEDGEDDDPVIQATSFHLPTKKDDNYPDSFRKLIPSKRFEMWIDPMGGKKKEEIAHYIGDCQSLGLTPAFIFTGPPSVGKTFLADCIAGSYNAPRIKVSCNSEMRPEHVLGSKTKRSDGSIGFAYAPALKSAMYGFVTLFDEIQTLSDDMTAVLHSFADESRVIEVKGADDEDEVQYVDVHPDSIVIGTANEGWAYKTFHASDPAFRSRFFVVGMSYPDQDTITDLLLKSVDLDKSHKALAKRIAGAAEKLREMFDNQELQYICDFRTMRQWLQMCKIRNPLEAGASTLLDKLCITEAERTDVRNVLEQYF